MKKLLSTDWQRSAGSRSRRSLGSVKRSWTSSRSAGSYRWTSSVAADSSPAQTLRKKSANGTAAPPELAEACPPSVVAIDVLTCVGGGTAAPRSTNLRRERASTDRQPVPRPLTNGKVIQQNNPLGASL